MMVMTHLSLAFVKYRLGHKQPLMNNHTPARASTETAARMLYTHVIKIELKVSATLRADVQNGVTLQVNMQGMGNTWSKQNVCTTLLGVPIMVCVIPR